MATPPLANQFDVREPNNHEVKSENGDEDELLLKWDDHHNSFFEHIEHMCALDQFIDVTLSWWRAPVFGTQDRVERLLALLQELVHQVSY